MSDEPSAASRGRDAGSWPDLTADWQETSEALLLWTQVVGKVRLALEPMMNHWWQVPLYVSAHGLTTGPLHTARGRLLEVEFDFLDSVARLRTSQGDVHELALEPQSVAQFYTAMLSALQQLDVRVRILGRPVEVVDAVPFAEDTRVRAYDPVAAHRFWLAMLNAHRVLTRFRAGFQGKASPVHFFWGGGDLAVTRFSGRPAPRHPGGVPNCADWVQELAYSHEVSSCGFWPGNTGEGMFYSYAYPEPDGFGDRPVEPADAVYDESVHEFVLPYKAVRESPDPDATLLRFLQSTYEAAAVLAAWDRGSLES